MLSRRFFEAVKLHPAEPAYRLALRHGIHPNMFSKLLHGAVRVRPGDARIIAIGRELGLTPEQCFDVEHDQAARGEPVVATAR